MSPMAFPTSRIPFVAAAAAALLLAVSVHVPRHAAAVPVPAMPKGASFHLAGGAGGPPKPQQLQDVKLGIPVCNAQEFVQAHNKVRGGLGLPPLEWDKDLAKYSRRFAAKRAQDCKMIHSFGQYGENIFWGAQAAWSPSQIVESWVSEDQFYDPTHNSCADGQMCGHYTQVVWRDTARVGCAWVACLKGGMYAICSYDPPGNYVNESPFQSYAGQ
ncbi:hypothetical protein BT93_K0599 [Corymbia citriodora subsp. variegata]|nr:hypothetical protein BT93_K0599 [Corymbia citriodora subsp. variegata]